MRGDVLHGGPLVRSQGLEEVDGLKAVALDQLIQVGQS
jgi:hypothetical protein